MTVRLPLGSEFGVRLGAKLRCLLPVILGLLCVPSAEAALSATFQTATDIPITAASYTPAGDVDFTLNFAPEPGTNLTVVKNTGLPFINGTFANLPNGATVNLTHNGTTYPFVAWYYGGEGNNDLVLLWPYMRMAAWGSGSSRQLGNLNLGSRNAPIGPYQRFWIAGKFIVQVMASGRTSFALTTEGKVFSWGSGENGMLGANQFSPFAVAEPEPVNVNAGISALFGKTVVSLAGGASHCLALCSDGTLVSWGNNANGQLGDNTTTQRIAPVLVNAVSSVSALAGKTVVAIAAGESHSLALCSDGTLTAWGSNTNGQLGAVPAVSSQVPVFVDTAEARSALFGKSVVAIDAGTSHNLALCTDGTLVAWGSNASGELGDDSTIQRDVPVMVNTTATSALNGRIVTRISAGGASSLALCSDGTLAAWGSNSHGQLGDGSTNSRQVPGHVSTESGSALQGKSVMGMAAAGTSSLALCSDGTLVSWGDNSVGQLGDGSSSSQRLLPVAVNTNPEVSILAGRKVHRINDASVYQSHSLVLLGMVRAQHMLVTGNGVEVPYQDTTPSTADHTDFGPANLNGATVSRTFTITSNGLLDLTFSGSPVVTITGAHAGDFSVVAPYLYSSMSLPSPYRVSFEVRFDPTGMGTRSATVRIGNNIQETNPFTFAIQGSGTDPEIVLEQPAGTELIKGGTRDFGEQIPGNASDMPFVIRNAGGEGSLLSGLQINLSGANASDFSVVSAPVSPVVGPNGFTTFVVRFRPQTVGAKTATLSIASNDADENPYQIQLTGSTPASLSASFNSASDVGMTLNGLKASVIPINLSLNFVPEPGTCLTVVRNTGLAHINGAFTNLANGATVNLSYNGTSYSFVAWYYGGEGNNDLVLVWPRTMLATWGDNSRGQLGDGTTAVRKVPGAVDQNGALLGKTVVQVARGHNFVLALTSGGQVFSWGDHSSGQLGTGNSSPTAFSSLPLEVTGGSLFNKKVVCIAAGHSHALALCSDNTLAAWGSNLQGQLGNGFGFGNYTSPIEVSRHSASSVLAGKMVVSISAGGQHSLALCSDGTVAAWGNNQEGQLGSNSTAQQIYPKAVSQASGVSGLFGKTVREISAGSDHSLALCSDGTMVAWGGNAFGQLGINSTIGSLVPVLVSTTNGVSALSSRTVVSMIAAGSHSRVLCSDGAFIAWGANSASDLGDGTTTDRLVPWMVNPPGGGGVLQGRGIVTFAANQALCSDGTLAAWGDNSYGQVGDDTTVDRPTPVAVSTDSGLSTLAGRKVTGLGGPGLSSSPSVAVYAGALISKIGVNGNGADIAHGDTTPSTTDHTDFVAASVTGGSVVRTFTVRNWEYLPLHLTGEPKVQISGAHASEFAVTAQPASPVAPFHGSNTFQITFDPTALGERSATVSIASDDESLPTFTFTILGRGVDPELVVDQPAGTALVHDEIRDFRKMPVGAERSMVFTVKNIGVAGSQLSDFAITLDGTNPGDFSVIDSPDAPVAGPAGRTTFTVRFSPKANGPRSATLHLTCNDPDDSPFDVHLTGEGFTGLEMVFNAGTSSAHVGNEWTLTGATLNMTLNYAPEPGTNLTVINNTGSSFIEGAFTNVPNGGTVNLSHNGSTYSFVAWYYGGEGNNDLVLLWRGSMMAGWGRNDRSQVISAFSSFPFYQPVLVPRLMDNNRVLEGKTIVQVAQGPEHCLALTTEGKVYAWGAGPLGTNGSGSVTSPVAVEATSGASSLTGKTVVAIAAGSGHCLALCSDGTVSAWGANTMGQVGVGSGSSNFALPIAVNLSAQSALAGKKVTAIAAGQNYSLALCSDGTVAGWGNNFSGQLGTNDQMTAYLPAPVNTSAGVSALAGKAVASIAAGASHSLALCTDGTLVAWGGNASGQLGDSTTTQRLVPVEVSTAAEASVLSGRTVMAISAGGSHSLALCSDGTMTGWGENGEGQLGDGSQTDHSLPVMVRVESPSALFGKTVTGISAGDTHSLALCADGTVASWGGNAQGQLGDNSQSSRSIPGAVNTAAGVSVLSGLPATRLSPMGLSHSSVVIFSGKPADMQVSGYLMNGDVVVSTVNIADDDTTPSTDDATDFGEASVQRTEVKHRFSIRNEGFELLRLAGSSMVSISGPHSLDFSWSFYNPPVPSNPLPTLASGRTSQFEIVFRPRASGIRTAVVTIQSNDPDESPYTFTIQGTAVAPEIEVRESGLNVAPNGLVEFGGVALGSRSFEKTFVINNLGTTDLAGVTVNSQPGPLTVTTTGQHPQDFVVLTQPAASVPPGGSTSFTVVAGPTTAGFRQASLVINNNDTDEAGFVIQLTVFTTSPSLPAVAKEAVTGITFDGATLKAEARANNSDRRVFFDYGTAISYGSSVSAVPTLITGSTPVAVSAVITGLLPNTTYHFRARVEGPQGSAFSKNKTFTTLNRSPVAAADSAVVLPMGRVTIPVLVNDTDPGDVLNIASFTQPPAAVGSVAKLGNTLVFTASAGFTGGSFTYMAGDAYRGKSAAAMVTLTLGTCTIGPDVTIPADSPPYELAVTATGPFGVLENISWLSYVPPAPGATSVTIMPAPNASKTGRTAMVKVGGQTHTVTQKGVSELPVLTVPAPIPNAAVSANYDLAIPTQNGPVTYTATGLPKGLTLSNVTGKITGYPTEAKTSTVTVKAKNVQGDSNTISFDITILRFPLLMAGSYSATIPDSATLTDKLGGLMTMTVTGSGGVTGTLKLGAGSHPFTGRLNTAENPWAPDPDHAVLKTSVKRTGKPSVDLTVRMNSPSTDLIAGEVTLPGAQPAAVELTGSRHVWQAAKPANDYKGYFTVALFPSSTASDIPQGKGFLTFTVSPLGGVSWSGQLADGTVIPAQTATLWANGRLPLFALLYGGKGSLSQSLASAPVNRSVTGALRWHKKPQVARAHSSGFEPSTLQAFGGEYLPPSPGDTLFNLEPPATVGIDFLDGGIGSVGQFSVLDQVFNVSSTHVATVSDEEFNYGKVKLTKVDVAKGTFTGTFTLKDDNRFTVNPPLVTRVVTFQGALVPSLGMGTG